MKYFLLLFLITGITAQLKSQNTQVATAEINFTFIKKDVVGSISGFSSSSKIDWNQIEKSVIAGQVNVETLKTGNFIRDWSLKGEKYFNTDAFPVITFKSNRIVKEDSGILVYGMLTLKGITKRIEIKFIETESRLIGTTTLFTPDFDITILKNSREDNKVIVTLNLALE